MSVFLPEKGVLFLHIPRTGGSWTSHAMHLMGIRMDKWGRVGEGEYRPKKHTIPLHYRPDLLEKVKFAFAFVRHPIKYYVSVWRFTTRCVAQDADRMRRYAFEKTNPASLNEAVNNWKPDFNEWMEWMLENEPGWYTRWVEGYVGPDRGEFCYYIGRTETLEEDVGNVMKLIGYGEEWERTLSRIRCIHHAKNKIREIKAPHVEMDEKLQERVLRSERVFMRRFFGEESFYKRIYRTMMGEPV